MLRLGCRLQSNSPPTNDVPDSIGRLFGSVWLLSHRDFRSPSRVPSPTGVDPRATHASPSEAALGFATSSEIATPRCAPNWPPAFAVHTTGDSRLRPEHILRSGGRTALSRLLSCTICGLFPGGGTSPRFGKTPRPYPLRVAVARPRPVCVRGVSIETSPQMDPRSPRSRAGAKLDQDHVTTRHAAHEPDQWPSLVVLAAR